MTEKTIDRRDQTATPTRGDGRYHTLDGMRGIAALLVATMHYGRGITNYAPAGYLAVDFFFALSGFVIALNYEGRLLTSMKPIAFAQIRMVRLYPLYAMGIAFGLLGAVARAPDLGSLHEAAQLGKYVVSGLLFFPALDNRLLYPLNAPAWSLTAEIVLNFAYAWLLVRARSWAFVLVAAVGAAMMAILADHPSYLNTGWGPANAIIGVGRALFSFSVGVLLYRAGVTRGRSTWLALAPAIALIVLLIVPVPPDIRLSRDLTVALVLSPLLLVAGARWECPRALRPLFGFLGDISYPLYAVHWTVRDLSRAVQARLHLSDDIAVLGYVLAMLVLATLLGKFYDAPVRRWVTSRLHMRRSAKPQFL